MANFNAARGLQLHGSIGGVQLAALRPMKKEASVIIAPGDPVVLSGDADAVYGRAMVTRASAAGVISGVVCGIELNTSDLTKSHMAAADTGFVLVMEDENATYVIQEDSVGNNLALTDVGGFVDIIVANANTTLGISQVMIDSSTAPSAGDTGAQLRVEGLAPGSEVGANAKWIVSINKGQRDPVATEA